MSRFRNQPQGRTIFGQPGSDLEQKLTYQQLMKMNHDLKKQNIELKKIGHQLGNQLKSLHIQFQIKPRQQNLQLYNAIGNSPQLHKFETSLVPLLEAYENKIQEFQHGFETIHQEFFLLEKKFEEVCRENQEIKANLTDKSKELIEVYRNGISGTMQGDFGNLILEQINDKQKLLVEENQLLSRNYQQNQAELTRLKSETERNKQKLDEIRQKLAEKQILERQLQAELKNLKSTNFELQIKNNELEAQKRKIDQAHERAQSINNQLNKQKQFYLNKLEDLRKRIENDRALPTENNQSKFIEELQTKIAFLEAEQDPNDNHKKLAKLQRQFDKLKKQKRDLKEAYDSLKISEQSLKKEIMELREKIRTIESTNSQLEVSESRLKKSLDTLTQKTKADILRCKRENKDEVDRLEADFKRKIDSKEKKIQELDENCEKFRLERDKLEKQISLLSGQNVNSGNNKSNKQNERALSKLKDKLKIHEDFFKQQTDIYENDLKSLKSEYDSLKNQNKSKNQELRKLKAAHDQLQKEYEDLHQSKTVLIQEFKSVRDQYQLNLKDKESLFDAKIKQIKNVVQESDMKRRQDREKAQDVTKQYKRLLQEIKSTYEARIRDLKNEMTEIQYRTQITPVR